MSLRVGLVGSRFAANFHADCYRGLGPGAATVAGVYSPTPARRDAFAKRHGVAVCSSLDHLLDVSDVIDVCAPPYAHEPCVVAAAEAGKHVIVEKPFTGAFGPDGDPDWQGDRASKAELLAEAMASAARMRQAVEQAGVTLCYAENWVYAPSIRKEVEVIVKTQARILWIHGEESHSGSHSPVYGIWAKTGGGSLVGKGCHPLTAALYLKRVQGRTTDGAPVRPRAVSARVHRLTAAAGFRDRGWLRTDYRDVEDYCQVHVVFDDGTVADIHSTEIVMGGVHNWLEVYANNHRMRCNVNPTDANLLYNPEERQLDDVYVVEKIGTKQGWSFPAPDEDWATGYRQELADFLAAIRDGREPASGLPLALDTTAALYAAYLSAERDGREVAIPRLTHG